MDSNNEEFRRRFASPPLDPPKGAKWSQNDSKMEPKWSRNGAKVGGNSKENSRKTAGKAKEHLGKIQAKPKENRGKIKEDIQNHTVYPTITPTHPTQGFDIFTRRSNPKNRGGGFARMRSWIVCTRVTIVTVTRN